MKIKSLFSMLLMAVLLAFITVPVMADQTTPDIVPGLYDAGTSDVFMDALVGANSNQLAETDTPEILNDNLEHFTVTQAYALAVHVDRTKPGSEILDVYLMQESAHADLVSPEVARLSSSTAPGI